ncbi:dynamin family protein [Algicella marina]|uniref:Dynamin N-terminal domain-containing protein n=1 Tax=Algicella marina TaxID=2683284 RepID=A0A6P1T410_9RHOB|nr:dynamin family protein [Algicella marina]QHQ35262.1 hypothetical protein GO499_08645 [Algicella marina]
MSYDKNGGSHILSPLKEKKSVLRDVLEGLALVDDERLSRKSAELRDRLDNYSAKVTLVGQVKAGKTLLANTMIGAPGLLPSDVNPWTSVVTTVHMNETLRHDQRAVFKFFDKEDWKELREGGGRLGEMARRTNSGEEMEELAVQLATMEEKTRRRLGANFELLLGGRHNFSSFDSSLIERYVCVGEEDDEGAPTQPGRFADMTKSADLYLETSLYEVPLSICDTPGVNDPFLVREQVTLNSLGDTDICVVVLSAHQALTTMDIALLRVLVSLKNEQIILFVNRIDELPDPKSAEAEIEKHIRDTLKRASMLGDIPIIFGSALWAEAALNDSLQDIPEESAAPLLKDLNEIEGDVRDLAFRRSGLPELQAAIAERIENGSFQTMMDDVVAQTLNSARQARMTFARGMSDGAGQLQEIVDPHLVVDHVDNLVRNLTAKMADVLDAEMHTFTTSVEKVVSGFRMKETRALAASLNAKDAGAIWASDTAPLRRDLKDTFVEFSERVRRNLHIEYATVAKGVEDAYRLTTTDDQVSVDAPQVPLAPVPTIVSRKLAMDMGGSWWSRWLGGARKADTRVREFAEILDREVEPVVAELCDNQAETYLMAGRAKIAEFVAQHCETLERLSKMGHESADNASEAREASVKAMKLALKRLESAIPRLETLVVREAPDLRLVENM